MISKYTVRLYCKGDIAKIENYDLAIAILYKENEKYFSFSQITANI